MPMVHSDCSPSGTNAAASKSLFLFACRVWLFVSLGWVDQSYSRSGSSQPYGVRAVVIQESVEDVSIDGVEVGCGAFISCWLA